MARPLAQPSSAPVSAPVVVTPESVTRAAHEIRDGSVVGFPTETCYGLAADPYNDEAVEALFRIKGRPANRAIPILVADRAMLEAVVMELSPIVQRIIETHWPGPLTLVLPARASVPATIRGGEQGGVGVRISSDPVASALVAAVGGPITATSANRSGDPVATDARGALLPGLSSVLDDGSRTLTPSTVVSFVGAPTVLRQGNVVVDLQSVT